MYYGKRDMCIFVYFIYINECVFIGMWFDFNYCKKNWVNLIDFL